MTALQMRNAACPCGSGLRYKHCCGRNPGATPKVAVPMYMGWDRFPETERAALWATMQEALAAQKLGQLDASRVLYEEVVARAPLTFDAVHMLGVVLMQQGDLDSAESMLTRALELTPGLQTIHHNLEILRHRKRDHEGIYSASIIMAVDALRLLHATRRLANPLPATNLLPDNANECVLHVVVPGDVLNAAANRSGVVLVQPAVHPDARLWTDPKSRIPMAVPMGATTIDPETNRVPAGGIVVIFGLNSRTLDWLPGVAGSFESIVVALDAHDPPIYVEFFDRLPTSLVPRVRLVARSAEILADLGLPGVVDPLLGAPPGRSRPADSRPTPRLGVFIPPLREREDAERWAMLEWLRSRGIFLRVLYPGPLPSRHVADDEEHLVSLVTEWDGWWSDLDVLFFWGAEGRMRQYDRLVFEALDVGMRVVADGFGDYAGQIALRPDCATYFEPTQARCALDRVLRARCTGPAEVRSLHD